MNNSTLLSLIIPLYNVADYLPTTLQSVAQQTLEGFEVILVDDGSTDRTHEIAQNYCEQHPTWQLITQPQQGVSVARNVGTQRASGEYVAYLDGDDWLFPHTLHSLLSLAHKEKADLVQGGFYYAYEDHLLYDNRQQQPQGAPRIYDTESALSALCQPHPTLNNFLWAKLIRREIALACPNPPGRVAQDAFVMHEIVARCEKVVVSPQPLWFYRQRSTGLSGHFSVRRKDLLEAYEARIKFCLQTQREHLLKWIIPEYLRQISQHLAAAKRTKDVETIRVFTEYSNYALVHYTSLIKLYAPLLWNRLKWEHLPLVNLFIRVVNRLKKKNFIRLAYKELS